MNESNITELVSTIKNASSWQSVKAEKLKDLRRKTGYSQTRFGEVCGGIPLRTIQNWESGIRECPDYVLFLIKSHLKSQNLI